MPIYKMKGKKDGLQKYRVRINYTDNEGNSRQMDRVAYGVEAAKRLEMKLTQDINENPSNKMTVQELCDEFLDVKKREVRESTAYSIQIYLNRYILPFLKDYRLTKLTPSVLQKWKSNIDSIPGVKVKTLSLAMKKSIFKQFRALLNYAVKMEYIPKNPLITVGNFKDAYAQKSTFDFYMPEEFKKFITAAREAAEISERETHSIYEWNFYIFFNIAFYTGARKGEINALKWTDLDGNILHIERSINQKLKGNDRETPPKNQSSIRDIQLPIPLLGILKEHYQRYQQISGFNDDWRICGGTECIRDSTIKNKNILYAKAAGLKTIRIHDFRHSHASLLVNEGINIQEIARRLGHAQIEMTWNTYAHLYPREEEKAVQILNKIV